MKSLRVFISSVQKEFSKERIVLRDWLRNDPLMRQFFDPFLFEGLPAIDRSSDEVYLNKVAGCDVYIGIIGNDYGFEDANGISLLNMNLMRLPNIIKLGSFLSREKMIKIVTQRFKLLLKE